MKGLIITMILFIGLLVTICINVQFVENVTKTMQDQINLLNPIPCQENENTLDLIAKNWDNNSLWLSLSVSYDDIEELTDVLDGLRSANATNNTAQFQIHIELLINAVDEISRLEKFSIKNIL